MKKSKLPKSDCVRALAEFWDNHDLTDFEDELEEVVEPVFARSGGSPLPPGFTQPRHVSDEGTQPC